MALPDRDSYGGSILERGLLGIGDRLGLLAGVVLAVSAFTGWYSGAGEGVKVSVTGWDTGIGGKAVFFIGIAVVLVVTLREAGVEPPAAVPQSLVTIFLGSAATIIVLVTRDLDPGRLLLRRPWRRDLDQPRGCDRRDRGRSPPGVRRALSPGRGSGPGRRCPDCSVSVVSVRT